MRGDSQEAGMSSQFPENAERTSLHADFLERSPTERQSLAHLLSNRTETSVDTTVNILLCHQLFELAFSSHVHLVRIYVREYLLTVVSGEFYDVGRLTLGSGLHRLSHTCSRQVIIREWSGVRRGIRLSRRWMLWGRRVSSWRYRDRQVRHHKFVCRRADLGGFLSVEESNESCQDNDGLTL